MSIISLGEQVELRKSLRQLGLELFQGVRRSWAEVCGQRDFLLPTGTLRIVWDATSCNIFFPIDNLIGSVVLKEGDWQLIPVSDEDLRAQLRAELAGY